MAVQVLVGVLFPVGWRCLFLSASVGWRDLFSFFLLSANFFSEGMGGEEAYSGDLCYGPFSFGWRRREFSPPQVTSWSFPFNTGYKEGRIFL